MQHFLLIICKSEQSLSISKFSYSLIRKITQLHGVLWTCNPSSWKADTGRYQCVWSLQSKSQFNQYYIVERFSSTLKVSEPGRMMDNALVFCFIWILYWLGGIFLLSSPFVMLVFFFITTHSQPHLEAGHCQLSGYSSMYSQWHLTPPSTWLRPIFGFSKPLTHTQKNPCNGPIRAKKTLMKCLGLEE